MFSKLTHHRIIAPPVSKSFLWKKEVSIVQRGTFCSSRQFSSSHNNNDNDQGIPDVPTIGSGGALFSDTPPVLATTQLLCAVKDVDGFSWTGVILAGTMAIRVLFAFPLAIAQQKSLARYENLQPQLKAMGEELKKETAVAVKRFKWNEKTTIRAFKHSYKKHWRTMVEENNCHPMRAIFLTWLQLPIWICFSSALRNVVYQLPLPKTPEKYIRWLEIQSESLPWLASLSHPDPIVFPLVFMISNLLNIQIHAARKMPNVPKTKLQKVIPWVFRVGIVGMSVFAMVVPGAVSMYWATSSLTAFGVNLLLKQKSVRKFFRIPSTPSMP